MSAVVEDWIDFGIIAGGMVLVDKNQEKVRYVFRERVIGEVFPVEEAVKACELLKV